MSAFDGFVSLGIVVSDFLRGFVMGPSSSLRWRAAYGAFSVAAAVFSTRRTRCGYLQPDGSTIADSGTSPQFMAHDSSHPDDASFFPLAESNPYRQRDTLPHAPQT
jgi:hypothetical protein